MDDVNTDTLPNPSAETPGDKASVTPEIELELDAETAGDGQVEGADDELEDWEDEGKTYKVPKALKPRLMKDADYTRKTTEVAETRKAIEAQKAEVEETAKFHRENIATVAKLVNLDEQLAAFRAITPEQWASMDAEKASKLQIKMNLLKDQKEGLVGELQQKQREALEKQRSATAKQYEDSISRIAKEIPGWSDELAGKLNAYAMGKGYTEEQLRSMVLQPQAVSTLHKAYQYDQLVAKQRAKAKQSAAEPEPTPVPKVGARRAPPSSEPLDTDPPDVWLRKRNKQAAGNGYR
jgi:hypothetical protein